MLTTAWTDERLDAAVPCLEKPFTVDTLKNRVQQVLERARESRNKLSDALSRSQQEYERTVALRTETAAVLSEFQQSVSRSRQSRWDRQLQQSERKAATVLVVEDDPVFR